MDLKVSHERYTSWLRFLWDLSIITGVLFQFLMAGVIVHFHENEMMIPADAICDDFVMIQSGLLLGMVYD